MYKGRRVGVQSVADPDTEVTEDRLRQLEYCLPPSFLFVLLRSLLVSCGEPSPDGSVENVVRSLYETKESVANVLGFYRSEADHKVRQAKAVGLAGWLAGWRALTGRFVVTMRRRCTLCSTGPPAQSRCVNTCKIRTGLLNRETTLAMRA